MGTIPEPLRAPLAQVLARIVVGNTEGLKRNGIDPYPDADLLLWVREYGPTERGS